MSSFTGEATDPAIDGPLTEQGRYLDEAHRALRGVMKVLAAQELMTSERYARVSQIALAVTDVERDVNEEVGRQQA